MCDKKLLSIQDIAEILGVRHLTVRRMVKRGALKVVRIPGLDRVLFDPKDIEELIESSKVVEGSIGEGPGK